MSIGKLRSYKIMEASDKLRPYLLPTAKMNIRTFRDFLNKYDDIIVKPIRGRRGNGVIKVTYLDKGKYEVHADSARITVKGIPEAYRYMQEKKLKRPYMIQKRHPLSRIDGHPVDFRVITQRKQISAPWEVTAKVIKVAGTGYIITNNARSNGKVLPIKVGMKKLSFQNKSWSNVLQELNESALLGAKQLTTYHRKKRIYGFDIGVDNNGQVKIIEGNRFPMLSHFRKLKNKTLYRKILRYKRGT